MGNLQSSSQSSRGTTKSRNKRPLAAGTRDWLMGGATRALRKPVAPAAATVVEDAEAEAAAVAVGHVTVTSRDLRRQQQTPPARDHDDDDDGDLGGGGGGDDDTDHHADEQQQQRRQEHHCRGNDDQPAVASSSEEEDSSVFADTLTSPQSVYSDARDEPDDDGTVAANMVVNGGETLGGSAGRTAHQAFTIVKHRKVELNPTKIQSNVTNGKSLFSHNTHTVNSEGHHSLLTLP